MADVTVGWMVLYELTVANCLFQLQSQHAVVQIQAGVVSQSAVIYESAVICKLSIIGDLLIIVDLSITCDLSAMLTVYVAAGPLTMTAGQRV